MTIRPSRTIRSSLTGVAPKVRSIGTTGSTNNDLAAEYAAGRIEPSQVLIAQERMATNHVYVFKKSQPSKYTYIAECRQAFGGGSVAFAP